MPYLISYTVCFWQFWSIQSIYVNAIVLSDHHNNDKGFALKRPHNKINTENMGKT